MYSLLLAGSALAGPLGPWEAGASDTGLGLEPACAEQYPYALTQLPDRPALYKRWNPFRSWGTPALVDAVIEATGLVASKYPDSDPVFVGDLSTRRGGALPPHRYHHDGRSADVGLFRDGGKQPVAGFEPLWSSELDLQRTWTLIHGLLETGRVEHILLDQGHIDTLKRWLLDEGRLWAYEGIVRHAPRHRDHLHVRMRCER